MHRNLPAHVIHFYTVKYKQKGRTYTSSTNTMLMAGLIHILLPLASQWARRQEKLILEKGVPLDDDQRIDAHLVGVKDINRVRLLPVDVVPIPKLPAVHSVATYMGLRAKRMTGSTFRYGIYIRTDCWHKRKLIVHELAHTMQYERLGFTPFIREYLRECITFGYPNGPLEQEARQIATNICTNH